MGRQPPRVLAVPDRPGDEQGDRQIDTSMNACDPDHHRIPPGVGERLRCRRRKPTHPRGPGQDQGSRAERNRAEPVFRAVRWRVGVGRKPCQRHGVQDRPGGGQGDRHDPGRTAWGGRSDVDVRSRRTIRFWGSPRRAPVREQGVADRPARRHRHQGGSARAEPPFRPAQLRAARGRDGQPVATRLRQQGVPVPGENPEAAPRLPRRPLRGRLDSHRIRPVGG
jgi:hypothetical protein